MLKWCAKFALRQKELEQSIDYNKLAARKIKKILKFCSNLLNLQVAVKTISNCKWLLDPFGFDLSLVWIAFSVKMKLPNFEQI